MSDQTQNALRLAELATQVSQIAARAMTLTSDALRWRKCAEERPPDGVPLLVSDDEGTRIAQYEQSREGGAAARGWWDDGDYFSRWSRPTDLWLPIPPRPKAE